MGKGRSVWFAVIVASALMLITVPEALAQQDDWKFGIGTGFFGLNVDGDVGFDTALGTIVLDAELDNSDVRDLTESAFGFGGFFAKNRWQILYAVSHLTLEDSADGVTQGGASASADVTFDALFIEIAGVYGFARSERNALGLLFGGRHVSHEYDLDVEVGASSADRSLDESWTDALVGLTHTFRFSPKLAWASRADAGFGGSEGTLSAQTGLNWQVAEILMLSFYGKGTAHDFENGDPGDSDYYLYDATEFGVGVGFLFTF